MATDDATNEERLRHARELVERIQEGNTEEANRLIDELGRLREENLFQQLGKLTRDLHEALNSFRVDSRIADITQKDIPDAQERLNYVVEMTEQSAHRTLNAVEESLPISEELGRRAVELQQAWARFRQREMSAEEFRTLSREIDDFLGSTGENAELIRSHLSEVLMAQDFQDITGQIIRRVIHLVHEVEENLVGLVRISGQHLLATKPKEEPESHAKAVEAEGPQVPGVGTADVVSGQDEVDELLSSLGF